MKNAIATLKSMSPYSQSRPHQADHVDNENPDDYDRRTWREHLHCDNDGNVIVPPGVWKNSLDDAAQFLSMKIPGGRSATYTKHFGSGVMVLEPTNLGVKKQDVPCERLFLNADGKRGGGKRVWRSYPIIHEWQAAVEYLVLDDKITEKVFREHIEACGRLIGIGRFRPRNRGYYGRFEVLKLKWE